MRKKIATLILITLLVAGSLILLGLQNLVGDYIKTTKYIFTISPRFRRASAFRNDRAAAQRSERWGFIDKSGEWIIKPHFLVARNYHEKKAAVKTVNGWGFIDRQGDWIIKPRYERVRDFSEGFSAVKHDGKWGYVDAEGSTITKIRYEWAESFSEGRAEVQVNSRKGFINRAGEIVVETKFRDAHRYRNGLAPVKKEDWGYVNKRGTYTIEPQYEWASPFFESKARVLGDDQWWFIDRQGKKSSGPFRFSLIDHYYSGRARFRRDNSIGFVGKKGQRVIQAEFSHAGHFQEGLARAQKGEKWGYIGRNGQWVLDPKYPAVGDFSEGLARVRNNGRWGYVGHPHNELDSQKNRIDSPEPDISSSEVNLKESLAEQFSNWKNSGLQKYSSAYDGTASKRWELDTFKSREIYETRMAVPQTLYEVTRFPYRFPSPDQLLAAQMLRSRTIEAVSERNLQNYDTARAENYRAIHPNDTHYLKENAVLDGESLVPFSPEVLMFRSNKTNEQRLTGVMYLQQSPEREGAQIGGAKTVWHYHYLKKELCFKKGAIVTNEHPPCEEGQSARKSPEMLHVWFLDENGGVFSTGMDRSFENPIETRKNE